MGQKATSFFLIVAACMVIVAGVGMRPAFAGREGDTAAPAMTAVSGREASGETSEVRVASFATRAEAESFVKKIGAGGYQTTIRSERTEDNKAVYSVFILIHGEQPKESAVPAATGQRGETPGEEMPPGTPQSFSDIFGGRSLFHASLALTELYTDNAYLSNQDRKSGSSTVLSPEVWILLPRTEERLPEIQDVSARAPGGLILSREQPKISRRYEGFVFYHADIPLTSNLPTEKTVTQRAAAGFLYNGNRFFAGVMDQFDRAYDVIGTGNPSDPVQVDKYISNLFDASVSYDTRNRFRFMLDYSNFFLTYDESSNDFQDRMDNGLASYVFYQIQPKTALFVEYDFIDITHDKDASLDSREHNFFCGVQWDITARSRGMIKAGYGIKDFTNAGSSFNNYIFEAQILHTLSSKNSLTLTAYRQTDETDYIQSSFITTDGAKVEYLQRLTARITGAAGLEYMRETYEGGDFTADGVTGQRKDNVYSGTLSLRYQFKKWLESEIGYEYTQRDSNFSDFSYTSNTMFFRIRGAI